MRAVTLKGTVFENYNGRCPEVWGDGSKFRNVERALWHLIYGDILRKPAYSVSNSYSTKCNQTQTANDIRILMLTGGVFPRFKRRIDYNGRDGSSYFGFDAFSSEGDLVPMAMSRFRLTQEQLCVASILSLHHLGCRYEPAEVLWEINKNPPFDGAWDGEFSPLTRRVTSDQALCLLPWASLVKVVDHRFIDRNLWRFTASHLDRKGKRLLYYVDHVAKDINNFPAIRSLTAEACLPGDVMNGGTALTRACGLGDSALAMVLLETFGKKCNLAFVDKRWKNACIKACERGHAELAKALLQFGREANFLSRSPHQGLALRFSQDRLQEGNEAMKEVIRMLTESPESAGHSRLSSHSSCSDSPPLASSTESKQTHDASASTPIEETKGQVEDNRDEHTKQADAEAVYHTTPGRVRENSPGRVEDNRDDNTKQNASEAACITAYLGRPSGAELTNGK